MRIRYSIFCILVSLIFVRCINYKPYSKGDWNEIIVIADAPDWEIVASTLREIFEKSIRTPQSEKIFSIQHLLPSVFSQFKTQKNLIVLSSLQSEGSGSQMVRQMVSPDARRGVESGDYYVFIRKNELARDQMFMLLISNTPEELKNKLVENREFLFSTFYRWMAENTEQTMYEKGEQKELEHRLSENYGWSVRIQRSYVVSVEDTVNNFVWLRQFDPDRFFVVHWFSSKDGSELKEDWVIERRNWMGKTFLDSMSVEQMFLQVKPAEFNGRYAIHVQGLWKIDYLKVGGPFQTWAFYDEQSKRIYLVDISVYSPGKDKMPHLQQLIIMAQTFKTDLPQKK